MQQLGRETIDTLGHIYKQKYSDYTENCVWS